jgi:hydroxyacylglutathione hydrolase
VGLALAKVPQIAVDELHALLHEPGRLQVIDVRRPPEFAAGHVPGAVNRPLDRIDHDLSGLDPARPTAVVCAGGYRSSAACSLLLRHGYADLRNVVGGTSAWVGAGLPVDR